MPIRSAQSVLNQYYAVRDDLLSGKLASYSLGDRNVTLLDMEALNTAIAQMEAVVVASETGPVLADMGGLANTSGIALRTTNYP